MLRNYNAPMLRNYNAPMLRNNNAPMLRNSISILSDESLSGWGGTRLGDGKSHPDAVASGQWTAEEAESRNINVLELKGALFTLKSLCSDVTNEMIDLKVDNMTTVSAVKKMGSKS